MRRLLVFALALSVLAGGCAAQGQRLGRGLGRSQDQASAAQAGMVAAANPMAVEAGVKVLRQGGSAIDAAIAVQAVLGLVEPQSSGLGGGAFMTYYDARTKTVTAYDGRESAPAGATPDMFLREGGRPMSFGDAVRSGRSTGAPGAVAMLALAHVDHGKLSWSRLFDEAERLAREGFPMPRRMAAAARRSATPDVQAWLGGKSEGDIITSPAYAKTVRTLAEKGPRALYEGPIASAIAARVAQDPTPGTLNETDLAAYRAKKGPALCRPYRAFVVCAPPAPSGGPGILMALGIYENTDIARSGPDNARSWFLFAEGQRLMYADRDRYVADPAFVNVPTQGLLDRAYLAARAALIGDQTAPREAGSPPGATRAAIDATSEQAGTSHFVIVDAAGNVVSMTTTVESAFGSGRMVEGFVLNNQLTDFSLSPTDAAGAPIANAVAPGKRPRSSMSPVIVLDRQGNFVAAIGSPGGNAIPAYVLKVLVGVIDWKLPLQQAVALPNLIARGAGTSAETDAFAPGVMEGLAARGIQARSGGGEDSGLHAVMIQNGKLVGAADPRREGVARAP